jgi:uncharacterized protein (TIGR01777 family)
MTIVIAGGSGFLGTALAAAWRREGHRVIVLTRQPRRDGDVAWTPDGTDRGWTAVMAGTDAVVNLAGEGIADKRWTAARKTAILESRIRATRAIVTAIKAARPAPTTLISSSAVGIYGTRGDEPLTEDSAPGSDFLADVCGAWEAEATSVAPLTRVVLLRTGVVLAKDAGALPQMARPFRFFAGGPLGPGRQYLSWIHLADWTAMVQWALATPAVIGPLNLTAPVPVTNDEFTGALGRAMRRPATMRTPSFALRLALGEMADALLLGGQRVLPAKAQRLGFEFQYGTLEAALGHIYAATTLRPAESRHRGDRH